MHVNPVFDSASRALRRSLATQDPHSIFCSAAGLFFAVTLVIDLLLDRPGVDRVALWILLAFCLTLTMAAILLGTRFSRSAGLICVLVFVVATVYFFSPWGDEQTAVSSAQELPILALYLGWFVRRPFGRIIMLTAAALMVASAIANPLFWPDGVLGVPTGVQMIVIALFCFEVGSLLWRHSEKRITTDPLTGALNRAGFMERLDRELMRVRGQAPFSLVVIDFDHFKQLNDSEGHAAGDRALVETVLHWQAGLRTGDIIGRTGGDEFALLLDRTDEHAAQQIVARLRLDSPTAWSWGISQARPGDTTEALFARADEILFRFKRARGRG